MGPPESFDMWNQRSRDLPQFKFWSTVMEVELLMTRFVRSLREGDFPLYVQSCDKLCGWFHALDHINYARWLPVHVRDMVALAKTKTCSVCRIHEGQFCCAKIIKEVQPNGQGPIFMLAGADFARIVEEFEAAHDPPSSSTGHCTL